MLHLTFNFKLDVVKHTEVLARIRKEDFQFLASLGYRVNLRPAWTT